MKLLTLSSLFLLLSACGTSETEIKEKQKEREKAISDSIANIYKQKIERDSIERINNEKSIKYINLMTIADSLFFVQDFSNAKQNYESALELTDESNNKKIINLKISNCSRKIEENSTIAKTEKLLLGKHTFGVQFIWDGYGSATIKKENQFLKIIGTQYSKDKSEYVKMNGTIEIIDDQQFSFDGNIKIYTKDCCDKIDKTGKFTFKKTGSRKYWRLQEFNMLCDIYTCAYYLDIFE